ncbi:MAG: sigma 54-interacting transcriptional regulator [Deltaproteobacteria bacterium]|nr:sigma 54-interacting transcriptional regulator [Deltaproteobacteria bacterium]
MVSISSDGPLSDALVAALTARGIAVVARTAPAIAHLVTAKRAPAARAIDRPWLWLAPAGTSDEAAATAVLAGAYDVIDGEPEAAAAAIARRLTELAIADITPVDHPDVIATSPAARAALAAVARAARTSMPVLLTGETGTGKDLAAHQLHTWSSRSRARFVPINCAAIPNDLIEAELFGYVRGAFSGAAQTYDGQFTAAAGGTVFLDEVDDTPPTLQVKLLRVLEDRVVSRLGENEWREVDFRLVAATNRDLPALVAADRFGGDLYQRLAIVQIRLPPLRERLDDLPALTAHFIAQFAIEEPTAPCVRTIHPRAMAALARYPWPGNIRELRNAIYHALVGKRGGDELLLGDLPEAVIRGQPAEGAPVGAIVDRAALAASLDAGRFKLREALVELEREALRLALERGDGSPTAAARLLGEVGRGKAQDPSGTVRAMMRRHGLGEAPRATGRRPPTS